jgi:hypothetical protein
MSNPVADVMPITAFGYRWAYIACIGTLKLRKIAMKKVTVIAAVAVALLFTLATGMATVSTSSPPHYVFGHHGSVQPLW